MQGLAWTDCKTVIDKLFVFGKNSSFYDPVAAIKIIIEQWVTNMFHMYPYLVGAACFQYTLHQCYIAKPF